MFLIESCRKKPASKSIKLCEFDDAVVDYAAELYGYVSAKQKEIDLLPQSSALALLFLANIQIYGSISIANCKSSAFHWGVKLDTVLSRLKNVQLVEGIMTNCQNGYFIQGMNWSEENTELLTISVEKDLKLAIPFSKNLYLTCCDEKAKYPVDLPKNQELSDKFYEKFQSNRVSNDPNNVKLRLILLAQSNAFSSSSIEKRRGESLSIIREFHRQVVPITNYFQALKNN